MARRELPCPVAQPGLLPQRRRRVPITVLWFLLVFAFVTIYQFVQALGPAPESSTTLKLLWLLPVVFVAFFVFLLRRYQSVAREVKRGIELLSSGNHAEAARIFELAATDPRGDPATRQVALYDFGLAQLRLGRYEHASQAFASVERALASRLSAVYHHSAAYMAICWALMQELDAAAAWLEEARVRAAKPSVLSTMHSVPEALLLCLRNEVDAAERIEKLRAAARAYLPAEWDRVLLVLAAFDLSRRGGDPNRVAATLAAARPFAPGEYDFLACRWPELAGFLESNGLSSRSATAA